MLLSLLLQNNKILDHDVHHDLQSHLDREMFPVADDLTSICSLVPAVIAALILFISVLQPILHLRPKWLKPFVKELDEHGQDFQKDGKRLFSRLQIILMVLIPSGLSLQIVAALYPTKSIRALLLVLPWVLPHILPLGDY